MLNVGWDGKAFTFPMSNDFSQIIGIRRRFPNGQKVSLKGSKTGLFIPCDLPAGGLLLLCEGPSDTAAALDLGFAAVGRPNSNSRTDMVLRFAKGRDIVVVGDNDKDDAGKKGAEKLAAKLALHCPSVKTIFPPDGIKDLRQWLNSGLTPELLQKAISASRPVGIKLRLKHLGTDTETYNG